MIIKFIEDKVFVVRLLKFCTVGFSGVFVDFGITLLCKELLRLNKYVANSAGFICAATSNYILNRIWTFGSADPDIARQYVLFMGFAAVGLLINNGMICLLHGRAVRNFYVVKLAATVVVSLWNFTMNALFTF